MTPLQYRVVALLRRRVAIPGQIVAASYTELADGLGPEITPDDVRAAIAELLREAFFPGRPHVGHQQFRGRLPG
jgi:hypothetical protein